MTLGEVLQKAATNDFGGASKNAIGYTELIKDGKFCIKLYSAIDKDAFIECSIPDKGTEEEKNYCRLHFLSLTFNAAIYGVKRSKGKKK